MLPNGAARITTHLAPMKDAKNQTMIGLQFLVDTGATRTTINRDLLPKLGYENAWIKKNKILLSEEQKPTLADGRKLDAFGIPAIPLTIDGYVIHHDEYFLTADNAPALSFLLGADILSYFDVYFKYSERRVYYEFRIDCIVPFTQWGKPFAYKLETS